MAIFFKIVLAQKVFFTIHTIHPFTTFWEVCVKKFENRFFEHPHVQFLLTRRLVRFRIAFYCFGPKIALTVTYPPKLRPLAKSEGEDTRRRAEVEPGAARLHQTENGTFCSARQLHLLRLTSSPKRRTHLRRHRSAGRTVKFVGYRRCSRQRNAKNSRQ